MFDGSGWWGEGMCVLLGGRRWGGVERKVGGVCVEYVIGRNGFTTGRVVRGIWEVWVVER